MSVAEEKMVRVEFILEIQAKTVEEKVIEVRKEQVMEMVNHDGRKRKCIRKVGGEMQLGFYQLDTGKHQGAA